MEENQNSWIEHWEQSLPEIDTVIMMSKWFSIGTDEILLEDEEIHERLQRGYVDAEAIDVKEVAELFAKFREKA